MKRALHLMLAGAVAVAPAAGAWAQSAVPSPDNLAPTPQMGWNSWNKFACNIDEKLIRETADAMVKLGLKEAGYQYINIDDCWHGTRDEAGAMRPDPVRFPSGMKALADYVHARGLKLGLYSDVGNTTCGGRPGSRGHEYQDAQSYAAWGIDYLKYDWCDSKGINAVGAYTTMHEAIKASGRPILLSICEWGDNKPWEWAPGIGQSWRTTGDIYPCWDCEKSAGSWSAWGVMRILDKQAGLRKYAGPNRWNDMDMLEVGMGMTEDEDRAHFSAWAMLASPLILGNDLRSMPAAVRNIVGRRDVIAINQDPLGVQALRFWHQGDVELWAKPLAGGEWAFMVLNRGATPLNYRYDWQQNVIVDDLSKREADFKKATWTWQDAWTGKTGDTARRFEATVPAHGVVLLRLRQKKGA
jgi:alpha-galactosidase